ncbi:MAG: FAD-binding oxidoreductase [Planctomycetes bacterium]|nr:FAD-binding oxidoreductase [Planctomycetota bacterium]
MTEEYSKVTHEFVTKLVSIVGPMNVTNREEALREYARDYTEIHGSPPEVVVRPSSTEEVSKVLKFANENRIPVTPVIAHSNVGGLSIPSRGGIQLDMRQMNKILAVYENDLSMVIEPGVTWQDVKDYLDANHRTVRFGYSLSPPDTSVMGNLLMDGLTNLSCRWGSQGHWILGMEVVLADGTVVRTGALSRECIPCTESPLPNVTGLFINFHGTTGVVTKLAVEVQPKPTYQRRMFILGYKIEPAFELAVQLARMDLCDDIAGLTWPVGRILFGELHSTFKDKDEPEVFIFVDYGAFDEAVFAEKGRAIQRVIDFYRGKGDRFEDPLDLQRLLKISPELGKFADWPMRLDFLLDHPGGGLTWVGTYGPASQLREGVRRCHDLMMKRGYPPIVVTRCMRGAHFAVLRCIAVFDHESKSSRDDIHELNKAIADVCVDLGFFPYKTPRWAADRYMGRFDPGFVGLLKKVKGTLDPHGILNPGKWVF